MARLVGAVIWIAATLVEAEEAEQCVSNACEHTEQHLFAQKGRNEEFDEAAYMQTKMEYTRIRDALDTKARHTRGGGASLSVSYAAQPGKPRTPRPSCLNSSQQAELPPILDQNFQPQESVYTCKYGVSWEHSDYLLSLMQGHDADPADYKFRVCWDLNSSAEERHFPWVQSAGGDWKYNLSLSGSIILNPMDQVSTWKYGFPNVMMDALDYYARMGEVVERKIIPRFMLFGWSKGATFLWPLGRWRQDLIQGAILLHGCSSTNSWWTTNFPVKSKSVGVVPHLFASSKKDYYVKCTAKDTRRQYKAQSKNQYHTYYLESPCGHHPERCWPKCNYSQTYVDPFWSFVRATYQMRQPCTYENSKHNCESLLCHWDDEFQVCDERHPARLVPSCERFCGRTQVASCGGNHTGAGTHTSYSNHSLSCGSTYVAHAREVVGANGMLSACRLIDGLCTQSPLSFQCFFQDQCP